MASLHKIIIGVVVLLSIHWKNEIICMSLFMVKIVSLKHLTERQNKRTKFS